MAIGVLCLFWVALWCVIMVFPGKTHMHFNVIIKCDQPHILQSVPSYVFMQHKCFLNHFKETLLSLNSKNSIWLL